MFNAGYSGYFFEIWLNLACFFGVVDSQQKCFSIWLASSFEVFVGDIDILVEWSVWALGIIGIFL